MNRRAFLTAVGGSLLASPLAPEAQQPRVYRVGVVLQGGPYLGAVDGLRKGLAELGLQEGREVVLHVRDSRGDLKLAEQAAGDLEREKVELIYAVGITATLAVKRATKDVPIVFVHPSDPIASGIIKSATEPTKNLTGVAAYAAHTTAKRLELFKEIIPGLRKILVFFDANNSFSRDNLKIAEAATQRLGLQLSSYGIKSTDELKTTVASLRSESGAGIFQIADDLFESETEFLFETARQKKLPTMFNEEAWAIDGALAAYGPSYLEMGRQAARLVDRIIKGEKPESLPVERASKFDLTLNYRTATFIGIRFPEELLRKAQKVIR